MGEPIQKTIQKYPQALKVVGLFLSVFAAYLFGRYISFPNEDLLTFLPGNGVAIAFFLYSSKREWPILGISYALANLLAMYVLRIEPKLMPFFPLINLCEVWLTCSLLLRFCGNPQYYLDEIRTWVRFVIIAALTAPALNSTARVLVANALGLEQFSDLRTWVMWWAADALGVLFISSLLIFGKNRRQDSALEDRSPFWLTIERCCAFSILIALCVAGAFLDGSKTWQIALLPTQTMVVLFWISLRLGRGATVVALSIFVLSSIALTSHDLGMFYRVDRGPYQHAAIFQAFFSANYLILIGVAISIFSQRRLRAQLRLLLHKRNLIQDEQHRWISAEIHDDVGQMLALAKMSAKTLSKNAAVDSQVKKKADDIAEYVEYVIHRLRALVSKLRPVYLDNLDLSESLNWLVSSVEKEAGVKTSLTLAIDLPVHESLKGPIFRICQEAVNNALKHSKTDRIDVNFSSSPWEILLEVKDFGQGMSKNSPAVGSSFGIVGMKERALSLGGKLEIISSKPHGVTVLARFRPDRLNL